MTIRQFISETDSKPGRKPIHVGVSDLAFSHGDRELKTTLGSCVAVIIYSREKNKDCSMSHFLLPDSRGRNCESEKDAKKYGNILVFSQIQKMKDILGNSTPLYAKIAGGAEVMKETQNPLLNGIGEANIRVARALLLDNKITITGEHTGGQSARAVRFFPSKNQAWIYEFDTKREYFI